MHDRAFQPPVKPEQTFKFSIITWVLDMTKATDLLGKELADLINRSVRATQVPILMPLPDWLILTLRQFESLLDYTMPMEEGDTDGRIFITYWNVMEVDIDFETDPMSEAEYLEIGTNDWQMSADWGSNARA